MPQHTTADTDWTDTQAAYRGGVIIRDTPISPAGRLIRAGTPCALVGGIASTGTRLVRVRDLEGAWQLVRIAAAVVREVVR